MDSLPTYFISYYNACKWFLIALEWDLSISITADRSPKSSFSNISLELLNYYIF